MEHSLARAGSWETSFLSNSVSRPKSWQKVPIDDWPSHLYEIDVQAGVTPAVLSEAYQAAVSGSAHVVTLFVIKTLLEIK